ncbi:hypothetical protein ARMSODRAFT_877428 [Armillaria solidipes]|uniref:Uncharacterized protein n=1 Tax=Armillaria solidipes TaxID=1076256 RepID=A0A2H3BWV2_9AGAR|nr:hypothetical protein ARMSODRAFT_877428 [Armillaria solidipes]
MSGPVYIGLLNLNVQHYTAYFTGPDTISFSDSLHGSPQSDVLPILCWAFAETPIIIPDTVMVGEIARQGVTGGAGSCSIAAHNFLERHLDFMVERWTGLSSSRHQDGLLRDLIVYNNIASHTPGVSKPFFSYCIY